MMAITEVVAALTTRVGKLNSRLVRANKPTALAVIFILWFPELLDPWLLSWTEGSLPHTFEDAHLLTSALFKVNMALIFIFKCAFCIALSLSTDVHDRKYSACIICLCIYLISPVVGLLIYAFQLTKSAMVIPLGLSFMFICRPVKLCSIFSQMPYPCSKWSRLYSSLFVFSLCISTYVALTSIVIPHPHVIMILVTWSVVIIGFLVLLPISIYLSRFVRPEAVDEYTIKRILIGIHTDIKTDIGKNNFTCCRTPKTIVKATIFLLILIPVLLSTVIRDYIYQIDGDDQGSNLADKTTATLFIWQLLAIPLGGVILLLVSMLNENTAGVLNLGLPQLINLAAVVLIFIDFNFEFTLEVNEGPILVDERDKMREFVGPLPARRSEIYEFYNLYDRPVRVTSDYFDFLVKAGSRSTFRVVNRLFAFDVELTVADPKYNPIIFEAAGNVDEIRNYVIKGNATSLKLLEVSGSEWVRPVKSPILVFMNTFINSMKTMHKIEIKDLNSSVSSVITATESTKSTIFHAPATWLKISYYTLDKFGKVHPRLSEDFETQPYSVYTFIIDKDYRNASYNLQSYLIMQLVADDEGLRENEFEKYHAYSQNRPIVVSAFRLHGAASSLIQVGYIHHFWTEAPLRLRTTVLAAFLVAETVIDRLLKPHVGRFDQEDSYVILILQLIATLWHFAFAGIFYYGLKEPREPDPSPSSADLKITQSVAFTDSTVIESSREYQNIPPDQSTPPSNDSHSTEQTKETPADSKTLNESSKASRGSREPKLTGSIESQSKGSKELQLLDNLPPRPPPRPPPTPPPPPPKPLLPPKPSPGRDSKPLGRSSSTIRDNRTPKR